MCNSSKVCVSGINPFDKSYNSLHHAFDLSILKLLANMGNFTFDVTNRPLITDVETYEVDPNFWVVEQIMNGSSQLSSTSIVLTPGFLFPVLYSFGINTFRPQLYYKVRSVREKNNIYYIPFSPEVWFSLFGLLLVITLALTFILGRETKLPHDTPYDIIAKIADEQHDSGAEWKEASRVTVETAKQREKWEMGEILLIAIGVLSQQGSSRDPSTSAARTLLLVMFFLALVSYTAYSASVISLVSLLPSAEKEQLSFSSDLPSNRKLLVHDTNFFRHSFQGLLFHDVTYVDLEEGLDHAMEGEALFVGEQDTSLTYIHRRGYSSEDRCSLARVFLGYEYQRVFVFQKNAKFKERINNNIIQLRQYGLLYRERKRTFDVRYPCSYKERASVSGFVSFNIDDIKPAIFLLGSGLFASLLLLFLEYFASSSSKLIKKTDYRRWKKKVPRLAKVFKQNEKLLEMAAEKRKTKQDLTQNGGSEIVNISRPFIL